MNQKKNHFLIIQQNIQHSHSHYLRFTDLASETGLRLDLIRHFFKLGLIDPAVSSPEILFDSCALYRIGKIMRLHNDLGIGWSGLGLVMDLLDKIDELEERNRVLQKRLQQLKQETDKDLF